MKKIEQLFLLILFGIIITSIQSCYKEKFDFDKLSTRVKWEPNVAIPIGHARITLRDMIKEFDVMNFLVEDEKSGLMYLKYDQDVFSLAGADLIKIPDQNFMEIFTGFEMNNSGFGNHVKHDRINFLSLLTGELLDSIRFKSSDLVITVSSTFQHTGNLFIEFPGMKKNGLPYSLTIPINDPSGNFMSSSTYTDLHDYTVDFSNSLFDANNIFISYDLVLNDAGSGIISPAHTVIIDVSFENIEYGALYGYIGQPYVAALSDYVMLDIFDNTFDAKVLFKNPSLNIIVDNSYGVPIELNLSSFQAYFSQTDEYKDILIDPSINPIKINFPSSAELGQSKRTMIVIDSSNCSNIRDIIGLSTNSIHYDIAPVINPDGYDKKNSITDSSRIDVNVELELPIWGKAEDFVAQDTINFSFNSLFEDIEKADEFDDIDWILLRMHYNNGFPAELETNVFFLRDVRNNYEIIDSLDFGEKMIYPAITDNQGDVIRHYSGYHDIKITKERFNSLKQAHHILVRGNLQTSDNGSRDVKFYADQSLEVRLGLQIQFSIAR